MDNSDLLPAVVSNSLEGLSIHTLADALQRLESIGTQAYLALGRIWTWIDEHGLGSEYGDHITTKEDFYREMGISKSSVAYYKGIWKEFQGFIELDKLDGVNYKKLTLILPVIRGLGYEEKAKWVRKARVLTEADLKDELREHRNGGPCEEHKAGEETWSRCQNCGKFLLISKTSSSSQPEGVGSGNEGQR